MHGGGTRLGQAEYLSNLAHLNATPSPSLPPFLCSYKFGFNGSLTSNVKVKNCIRLHSCQEPSCMDPAGLLGIRPLHLEPLLIQPADGGARIFRLQYNSSLLGASWLSASGECGLPGVAGAHQTAATTCHARKAFKRVCTGSCVWCSGPRGAMHMRPQVP